MSSIFTSCMKESLVFNEENVIETPPTINEQARINAREDVEITPADFDITLTSTTLAAGQHYEAGMVTTGIYSDPKTNEHFYTVYMDLSGTDWVAGTTHIYAGAGGYDALPLNGGGSMAPGQFPYGSGEIAIGDILADMEAGVYDQTIVYMIPLDELVNAGSGENCFTTLIHAEVYQIEGEVGNPNNPLSVAGSETAWQSGTPLNGGNGQNKKDKKNGNGNGGGNWAMYNTVCL